ncbi:MAG: NTP transferase domain-containing protein [Candidatus Magasanikbacteria bacterium]|jgi:UTP--glucose-1-phosphate uridylyltransferase|nr:NTP transferase domain-containing protein [Candidatus Magasanikbacteria bacterium]MBT4547629.1 NTP transferase domain-containing protein [Candidatus Magasanikbacteria bacterium]MBT6819266.1 NTP transferase domain-containing protein [Candidatus Magasanikbacteria bacterium]
MNKHSEVRKGVIVAAGLGTRFLPITKSIPKEMLPVGSKPVLQYIVEEMADSGIKEITIVISRGKESIKEYFKRDLVLERHLKKVGKYSMIKDLVELLKKVKFSYVYQEKPLGNGHALLCAKKKIGSEPFVFSDADSIIASKVPATKQILEVYKKYQAPVIGVQKIKDKKAMTKYGNVYANKTKDNKVFKVEKFVEKPSLNKVSPHGLIVGGMRYVFTKEIWKLLEKQGHGKGGEIWVADAANELLKQQDFYAYEYEGKYLDTGDNEKLLKTMNYFFKK